MNYTAAYAIIYTDTLKHSPRSETYRPVPDHPNFTIVTNTMSDPTESPPRVDRDTLFVFPKNKSITLSFASEANLMDVSMSDCIKSALMWESNELDLIPTIDTYIRAQPFHNFVQFIPEPMCVTLCTMRI
jgi:hypothetical protein